MTRLFKRSTLALAILALAIALTLPACGVGGSSAVGAGQGLILLAFVQDAVDNAVLNTRLEFRFSEGVDPGTITNSSIQIREGPDFGKTVPGLFLIQGASVFFEPQLAGLCDQSDSGLKPDTQYRVQVIGFPEEFSIRNQSGQPLSQTSTYEFHTRLDTDPNKYDDQLPGVGPSVKVAETAPQNGDSAVAVATGNKIVLPISENLNPCTVNETTVLFQMYEIGDPNVNALGVPPHPDGNLSGFSSDGTNAGLTSDQAPGNPFTWGVALPPPPVTLPQKILASINLVQSFSGTTIEIVPDAGKFPENALLVVQLTFEIEDYGNLSMVPFTMSFTTQNLPPQNNAYVVENEGETPWDQSASTADINTARSPSLVQGFMLFSGDGDNGPDPLIPTLPGQNGNCNLDLQTNDGTKDDFDPGTDTLLDTGGTRNLCTNSTDGSTAVIWEFNTFRIRNGFTVRVVGVNPAIFLVQGDILIENGGVLKARGASNADNGQGAAGQANPNGNVDRPGGNGVAGGGNGGDSEEADQNHRFGDDGNPGVGSADYNPAMPRISPDNAGNPAAPAGGGSAGQPNGANTSSPWDGASAAGGGGGHSEAGADGGTVDTGTNYKLKLVARSFGGVAYERNGNTGGKMQMPEAGSGGGSGGFSNGRTWNSSSSYNVTGGAGGAGGGFIDLTSSGTINILGTFDVAGGRGGDGTVWSAAQRNATGGAGGGSGGGGRLLTPNDIILATTAVVTAAGGAGGIGGVPGTGGTAKRNDGGAGGNGRLVFETSQGVVTGLGGATVVPGEGDDGFYRGPFDATRFQGGGLTPQAVSDLFAVGPFNPMFLDPVQNYGVQEDFIAGTPVGTTLGVGMTAILIEAQGFQMLPDGTADMGTGTGWFTVGHFTDSGVENLPTWKLTQPTAGELPAGLPGDNVGAGIANLDTSEFIQLRITMYLPATVGPFDAGSFVDRWTIRTTSDQ